MMKMSKIEIILDTKSVTRFNVREEEINDKCGNNSEVKISNCESELIPGLDADFCYSCRTYFKNEKVIQELKNKSFS